MLAYWFLYFVAVIGVLSPWRLDAPGRRAVWMGVGLLFVVVVGLRNNVGCDWYGYGLFFKQVSQDNFIAALNYGDPGYYGLNWLVAKLGGDVYALNVVCAVIAMSGIIVFCRQQPRPWLSFLVAVPYLIIVVVMGYVRQGVAVSLAMIGLVALSQQRIRQFVLWTLVAALFHKSAVLLLPVAALAASRRRIWSFFWVGVISVVGAYVLVGDQGETLWTNYVVADYQSSGGLIRIMMNIVPATILIVFHKRLIQTREERGLWLWLAAFSLACLPLVILSSTAVDRVALYLIPIQMFVFSRLPMLASRPENKAVIVFGIIFYYFVVELVWLTMAAGSECWVPYHSVLF